MCAQKGFQFLVVALWVGGPLIIPPVSHTEVQRDRPLEGPSLLKSCHLLLHPSCGAATSCLQPMILKLDG